MLILLSILTIVFIVFIHESGHLTAYQRHGIKVKEMAIGLPFRFLTITIKHRKIFQGVPIRLSPILLAGYVRPTDPKKARALSPEKTLDVSAAGIIMNLLFTCIAFSLTATRSEHCVGFIFLGMSILIWKDALSRYILPIISALMIVFIPTLIIRSMHMFPDLGHQSSVALPGIFDSITNWQKLIRFGGVVSLALAIMNLLPLSILDGGHLITVYLKKWFSDRVVSIYQVSTSLVMLLVTLACTLDGGFALARITWKFINP